MRLLVKVFAAFKKNLWLIAISLVVLLLTGIGVMGYRYLLKLEVKPQNLLGFFGTPKENLESTGGYTNFLLLGVRGEGQDSPDLSDTIIVVSYNHENQMASMIGVPRDLWVPSLKAKINTAYHYGEEASPGAGINFAQAAILEDLGLPIHYTAVINFTLFKQAIDLVGGVDVDVNPGFTDSEFPIPGREKALPISSRYESIVFNQGINHFDGETALKFVRSRHSVGEEGTDFARSARQQQVIGALRQKIITPGFLLDQKKVDDLLTIVKNNLKSNIGNDLYPTLAKLALDTMDKPVRSLPLTINPDANGVSILYNPPVSKYNGEWVLIPKDNNWNALKQYLKNSLSTVK
jgi:LCP family protein required for cell wall assembly